ARVELLKRLAQLERAVNDFGVKVYLPARDRFEDEKQTHPGAEFVAPEAPDFSKMAEDLGLKLSETGLTSLDDEEYKATGLNDAMESEGGRPRGRLAAEVLSTTDFYEPRQFQHYIQDEFYLVWKIDDVPEHQPSFDHIRDKVLLAFQMAKARQL